MSITGRRDDIGILNIAQALDSWAYSEGIPNELFLYGLGADRTQDYALSAAVLQVLPRNALTFLESQGLTFVTHEVTRKVGEERIAVPNSLGVNIKYRVSQEGLKKAFQVSKFILLAVAGRVNREA